jgi:hypothetical protein
MKWRGKGEGGQDVSAEPALRRFYTRQQQNFMILFSAFIYLIFLSSK